MDEQDANALQTVFRLNEEIEALLDDPDQAGAPVDFLVRLESLSSQLADASKRATVADFAAEYEESDDGEDEAESNGHGAIDVEAIF